MGQVEEIKLGFLGLGWPGEQHAKATQSLPGAAVHAACDLGAKRRETFAGQFSPAKTYEQYDDMLAAPEVQAVIV